MFADADYLATSNDRRSMSGVAVVLGDTTISWESSTHECVTTATCEAEYVTQIREGGFGFSVAATGRDLYWHIWRHEDAMAIANNPSSASRIEHIDVMFYFIQRLVRRRIHTGIFLRRYYGVRRSWCTPRW